MVQLSSGSYFQDDVDVVGVVEAAVHLDDVGVVEEHLDLHLSGELVGDLLLPQQTLLDDLQRADEVCVSLADQVDSTVLTVAELFDLDEIVNAHLSGLCSGWLPVESNHQLFVICLESGLYDQTSLHIVVASVQEGRSGPRHLLPFISSQPNSIFFIFVEIFKKLLIIINSLFTQCRR